MKSNRNTAIGYGSLKNNSLGTGNVALGYSAGGSVTFTDYNIFIGERAGEGWRPDNVGNDILSKNIFIGNDILASNVSGTNPNGKLKSFGNVFLGSEILHHDNYRNQIKKIDNSTFLGFGSGPTDVLNSEFFFSTAIGSQSRVGASNSIVLGRVGTSDTTYDKIGIWEISPTHRLHVKPYGTLDPVKIEGLKKGAITDALLVVDKDGILKKLSSTQFNGTATITQKTEELYSIISDQKKQIEELQTVQAELIKRIEKLEK